MQKLDQMAQSQDNQAAATQASASRQQADLTAAQTHTVETDVRKKLMDLFPEIAEVAIHHQTEMPVTAQPFGRRRDTKKTRPS